MKRMGKKQEAINEVNRLLQDYRKESAWARNNSSDPEALKRPPTLLKLHFMMLRQDITTKRESWAKADRQKKPSS